MKNATERLIPLLVVATGVASVATQLYLVRECMTQFQGNEIVIALVFFGWLLLGGFGALWARRFKAPTTNGLAVWSAALGGLAGLQIVAMRLLRPLVFPVGSSVGFYATTGFTLTLMAPYALLVGLVLPLSCRVLRGRRPGYPGAGIYIADNIGDICGGLLFTFFLVFWTTPLKALLWAHLPLLVLAVRLAPKRLPAVCAVVAMALLTASAVFERQTLEPAVGRLVAYKESAFARLTVHADREQAALFADGRPVAAAQSPEAAERAVHYPLCQLTQVRRILLISAGSGMMAEVAKYRSERVDYVELDPAAAGLLFRYGLLTPLKTLRVITDDGRRWLRNSRRTYDAIIVSLPEPDTFQLNRFFTDGFFDLAASRLSPEGVFSFGTEGFANYMTTVQQKKLSCLKRTAQRHFKHVRVLPGERIVFLCRQSPLDLDIPERLRDKGIATVFAGPYFYGDVSRERIELLESGLDAPTPVNKDMQPYLMQLVFGRWFTKFGHSPAAFIAVVLVLLGLFIWQIRRREAFVLFTTGFVAMGGEIVVIFAFQIFLGYIYIKIGAVVTVFLAGLLPGAWLAVRWMGSGITTGRMGRMGLMAADVLLVLLLATLLGVLVWQGETLSADFYYGFGFVFSLVCGFQFPVALSCLGDDDGTVSNLFAADLAGAGFGVLATSAVLIPYLGISGAIGVLMGVKTVSLLVLGGLHAFRN